MNTLELHNLLHRAGVGVEHRPDKFIKDLLEITELDEQVSNLGKKSENRLRSEILTVCSWHSIPQIPADRIVEALLNPDQKLLAELRREQI